LQFLPTDDGQWSAIGELMSVCDEAGAERGSLRLLTRGRAVLGGTRAVKSRVREILSSGFFMLAPTIWPPK